MTSVKNPKIDSSEQLLRLQLCLVIAPHVATYAYYWWIRVLRQLTGIAGATLLIFVEKHGLHFHVDAASDGPSLFSKRPEEENGRHRESRHRGRKHIVRTHGVEGPGSHDPEQCHFVAQTASYIIRKRNTVAGLFTFKGFRPGNVIFLHAHMKCFGSEGLELIVNRTARFCRHMADTLEATGRFDVVFVPVLSTFLHRANRYHTLLVLTTRLGPPALRWVSSPILHVQVSTLTESRDLQVKSDFWGRWPTHWACQAQGAEQGRLSLTGQCDLPPRTASPERIGESSRSSGSDCAAPGGMVKRTGRCVCHYPLGMGCAQCCALT